MRSLPKEWIDRAIEVLKPPQERLDDCKFQLDLHTRFAGEPTDRDLPAGEKLKRLAAFSIALKKLKTATKNVWPVWNEFYLSDPIPELEKFDQLREHLNKFEKLASEFRPKIETKKIGRRPDPVKLQAAWNAYGLLQEFNFRPTTTANGKYFVVASLLYERVTGRAAADLESACRWVFREMRKIKKK